MTDEIRNYFDQMSEAMDRLDFAKSKMAECEDLFHATRANIDAANFCVNDKKGRFVHVFITNPRLIQFIANALKRYYQAIVNETEKDIEAIVAKMKKE